MIIEYHRPQTLEEALVLLARDEPRTVPLGGGTVLNRLPNEKVAAVDLQALNLDSLDELGNRLGIGAAARLQALTEFPGLQPALFAAIRQEANHNQRQVVTVAGALVAAGGRSPFATAMLALDAQLSIRRLNLDSEPPPNLPIPGQNELGENVSLVQNAAVEMIEETLSFGDLLTMRSEKLHKRLITQVFIPLNARLSYHYVARTPADQPIVCASVAQWPSGRTRVALGGFGRAPVLALDGPEAAGAETAAQDAYSLAGDEWASAEYRREIAAVLTRRCLDEL